MKKIGLLGGMAWPSTIDYYRAICEGANARCRARGMAPPLPTPWITIESVNMAETRALRGVAGNEASWAGFDAAIRGVMQRLEGTGCEIAAMASNTPHARLHAFRDDIGIPIISILDETAKAAAATGAGRALVLGTSVTMHGAHYPQTLREQGIEPLPKASDADIDRMQGLIDTEFYEGATPKGRASLLEICEAEGGGAPDTVILLACTELPLAFPDNLNDIVFEAEGFRFINTAAAHVAGILSASLGDE